MIAQTRPESGCGFYGFYCGYGCGCDCDCCVVVGSSSVAVLGRSEDSATGFGSSCVDVR